MFLDGAGRRINLGGIAKGYALDRAAAVLLRAGVSSFVVQAGGDLYAHGSKPDGTPRKLMDNSRLFALGWKPAVTLEAGIRLAYADYLTRYQGKPAR